ncbi:MAG: TetR/AcrR family transcriptional regulator [Propionibacteriaceae bacterium]|nr:TetR/AcrR family transcriptional regulator [Propionibacteriaceae bacterium]
MPTPTFFRLPADKQERILNAAIGEFSQRNVEEANLANIVRAAGIARGSIYQYFENKEDIYVFVFETLRGRRSEFTRPAMEHYKVAPFLDFFEEYYRLDSQYLLEHPSHIELGKVMYSHARGVARDLIEAYQRKNRDLFLLGIAHDQSLGRIRPDVDPPVLADLCTHFMSDVFIFQNLTARVTFESVQRHLAGTMDIVRRGVAA